MLAVGDLGAPKLTREIAPPNAAVRAELGDDGATGIVHVPAWIRLCTSCRNEREFGMHTGQLRQRQHVFQSWFELWPRFQIQAVIDNDRQLRMPLGQRLNVSSFVAIDKNIDDDA